jgi:glycerate kinase
MNILIAFDKYKGAISAAEACKVAETVLKETRPADTREVTPLTDGGEGFASILASVLGGELKTVPVPGPRFKEVEGRFALVAGNRIPKAAWDRLNLPESLAGEQIGIVEMASASGYECLEDNERDPWQTTTLGTGILMKEAVSAGAKAILLGIGGSATNDCGAGALEALGVCYYDQSLQAVTRVVPETFRQIATLGSTSHLLDTFPPVRIACDVTNPLLGENGATSVFGPQKGLKAADAERMERTMRKMGTRILGLFGRNPAEWDTLMAEPGAGAAGGIGFALRHALPDSQFVEGFPLVADLLDLPRRIRSADWILTGEGRLDSSSLSGKGPVGLLRLAEPTKRVLILAGSIEEAAASQLTQAHPNLEAIVLSDPSWPLEKALQETGRSLGKALREKL